MLPDAVVPLQHHFVRWRSRVKVDIGIQRIPSIDCEGRGFVLEKENMFPRQVIGRPRRISRYRFYHCCAAKVIPGVRRKNLFCRQDSIIYPNEVLRSLAVSVESSPPLEKGESKPGNCIALES